MKGKRLNHLFPEHVSLKHAKWSRALGNERAGKVKP